jgi:hypothetical protein
MSDAAAHVTITLAQSADLPGSAAGEVGAATALQAERQMTTGEQPTQLAVTSGA